MKLTLSILFFILSIVTFGQDYQSEFADYSQKGDTTKQLEVLTKWEKEDPNNAELFTSYFNYYFTQAKQEVLSILPEQPEGQTLAIEDSTGQSIGFIGSDIFYLEELLEKAFNKIDKGIKLYPNRLDMRFGKIHVLGIIEDWEKFTEEIVKTIQYSNKNNNEWKWTNHEKQDGGKEFFLSSLQDYQMNLYNTEDDRLLSNMRTIALEVLKYYPDDIVSLSNVAITYLLTDKFEKALKTLLKAEKLDSNDPIILNNIAHTYRSLEKYELAIKYYEKTILISDPEKVNYIQRQLEQLKQELKKD